VSVVLARRFKGHDPLAGTSAEAIEAFLSAAAIVLRRQLFERLVSGYAFCRFDAINKIVDEAHDAAAIGLGRGALIQFARRILPEDECHADDALAYLSERRAPPLERLTLLEELLVEGRRRSGPSMERISDAFTRLLEANGIPLVLRDGRFEPTDGPIVAETVHDPFWQMVADERWDNVRIDMRQALNLRDSGGPNPALYAARALESAVKIVSLQRGWLTGKERGAAQVIDTLVSRKNGALLAAWEGEMLKRFFADVRNPDAHGAGAAPQPKLDVVQPHGRLSFA
jgi:hypothetical protein